MTQHHFDPDPLPLSSHPVMNPLQQSLPDCDLTVKKANGCVTLRPTEETGHRCTVIQVDGKAAPATSGQIHSACWNQGTALSTDPAGKQMHLFEDSGGCAAAASPVEGCLGLPSGSAEGQQLPF